MWWNLINYFSIHYWFKLFAFMLLYSGVLFFLAGCIIVSIRKTCIPPKAITKDVSLEQLVKQYINELSCPAPDTFMRVDFERRLAEKVGMENPIDVRRKWGEKGWFTG